MLRIDFYAMGSHMSASLDGESDEARQGLSRVPNWFEVWEAKLSRFRPDSELSVVNRNGAGWQRLSDLLFEHLDLALQAARYSDGLFDPSVLAALESLGYDRSFDLMNAEQPGGVHYAPAPGSGWQLIELDADRKRVRLPAGLKVDLGGVSKALAAEQAAARLAEIGPALVDAGGDIAVSGPRLSGEPWPIGVASPEEPAQDVGWLWLDHGVVTTSGRDFRHWQVGQEEVHHLIDPRTGFSADTAVVAATVVAPNAWQAEAGAKAALILGQAEGLRWLEHKPELEGILILEDGELLTTKGIGQYGWTG